MAVMKFSQLTTGAKFQIEYQSISVVDNIVALNIIDAVGTIIGSMEVNLANGTFTGAVTDVVNASVNAISQQFNVNDVVMNYSGDIRIVCGMGTVEQGTNGAFASGFDPTDGVTPIAWQASDSYHKIGTVDFM